MTSLHNDTCNSMSGLPRGFYDVVGYAAEHQFHIIEDFYRTGKHCGFKPAFPSEVGLENTYTSFGTAAHGRGYAFEVSGKETLMLASDSLASCIRTYLSMNNTSQIYRMMVKTPVFRHRHKKYRRWNHLIYSIFQEPDDVMAVLSLLEVANRFLEKHYGKLIFTISLYGLFECYCDQLKCTHEQMYDALHIRYDAKQIAYDEIYIFINRVEKLGKGQNHWHESLVAIKHEYPELTNIVGRYSDFFVALEHKGVQFYIDWENYHAIEYSSGICFLVKDANGVTIGDGGSYDYLVHSLNPKIEHCYSFACSLEAFPSHVSLQNHDNMLYLIKMDCTMMFFLNACKQLREEGFHVHELSVTNRLKEILKKLPNNSGYICVGQDEENAGELQIGDENIKIIFS